MAGPQYSVEDLIENIKRRCSVPTSQLTYTDQDWTDLANDELQGEVVPLIMSAREEYFLDYTDVLSDSSGEIDIPAEAAGEKLRSVCYVSQTSPLVLVNLPRLDLDVVAGVGFANYQTLAGFYVQGNKLMLYPNTSVPVGTSIRLYFFRRTLVLASPDNYGQVVSVDSNTNTVVLSNVPTSWEAGTTSVNSVGSTPPFSISNASAEVVAISDPSVELSSVEGIEVGDYIAEEGYSGVPQVLIEAHAYLAQLVAAKALEGLGDRAGMDAALTKAKDLKKSLLVMISQRVDGSVKKIVNPSGGFRINNGLWRRGYGRF